MIYNNNPINHGPNRGRTALSYCGNCGTELISNAKFCRLCGARAGSGQAAVDTELPETETIHLRRGGRIVVRSDMVLFYLNKRKVKHNKPVLFPLVGLVRLKVRRKVNWGLVALGVFFVLVQVNFIIMQISSGSTTTASAGIATFGPAIIIVGFRRWVITAEYSSGQVQSFKSYSRPLLSNLAGTIHTHVPSAELIMK